VRTNLTQPHMTNDAFSSQSLLSARTKTGAPCMHLTSYFVSNPLDRIGVDKLLVRFPPPPLPSKGYTSSNIHSTVSTAWNNLLGSSPPAKDNTRDLRRYALDRNHTINSVVRVQVTLEEINVSGSIDREQQVKDSYLSVT
ncbi:hypothetical protein BaRGS_00033182, partial [Batillaria attramentaria]